MKQKLILISLLTVLLASCNNCPSYNKLLVQVDSLMQSRPDSALDILKSFSTEKLKTEADNAYYALLLTQAQDKNYVVQTDDSLISIAAHYYDSIKDIKMQARVYYYWGSIYRDRNEQAKGVEKYIKAASFARKAENNRLSGRIYNNLGYLYYLQDMHEKSDSCYQYTEQIGAIMKDTSLWIEAISMQGKILFYQKNYSQAERKLLKAQESLSNFKQDGIRADIAAALSTLYSRMRDGKKALQYAKQNICLQKDTMHCYRAFLLLGEAYFWNNQYDSANFYFKKSLSTTKYGTKSSAYMRLANIAERQGDATLALKLERLSSVYQDSLNLLSQSTAIIRVEQQIKIQQQDTLYKSLSNKQNNYILVSIISVILFVILLYKRYKRRVYQLKHKQHLKEDNLRQQYILLKKQLKQKNELILALEKEIKLQSHDEKQKRAMENNLKNMKHEKACLQKESFESSDISIKMRRIITAYKEYGKSEESIKQKDWQQLITELNDNQNKIISLLQSQYHLSEEEIHLCCLFLTDLPISHFGQLLNCTRDSVYKKTDRILERKMGFLHKEASLPDVLKRLAETKI